MKAFQYIPWFAWLCLCFSCQYHPEGTAYKSIPASTGIPPTISLNDVNSNSTITIYKATTFTYSIAPGDNTITGVQVQYGSQILLQNSSPSGSITISGSLLKTGTNILSIGVQTAPTSKSLASQIAANVFQTWKTWTIVIDVDPPPVPVLSASTENGLMKISWPAYKNQNFLKYTVSWNSFGKSVNFEITDPTQTSYVNASYVGGYPIQYWVTTSNQAYSSQSAPLSRDDSYNVTGSYRSSDSTVLMSWDVADFPGAFKSYSFLENGLSTFEITDITVNQYRFKAKNIIMNKSINFNVRVTAISGNSPTDTYGLTVNQPVTTTLSLNPRPSGLIYNTTLGSSFGYLSSTHTINRYNDLWAVQDSYSSTSLGVATEGNYAYTSDANAGITTINLVDHTTSFLNLFPIVAPWGILQTFRITSVGNQVIALAYRAHDSSGSFLVDHVRIYDMANHVTLYHKESSTVFPSISSSGQYVYTSDLKVYQNQSGTLVQLWQFPTTYYFLEFRQGNNSEVVAFNGNSMYILDSSNGALKRTIPIPNGYSKVDFDAQSGYALFAMDGADNCYAINIDTQQTITIPVYTPDRFGVSLVNKYFFDGTGNYFKVIPN